jgi:hypothetical protein
MPTNSWRRSVSKLHRLRCDLQLQPAGEKARNPEQAARGSVNGYRQPALAASASDPSSVDSERDHSGNITFPLATEHRDLALGETKMIADLVNVYFEVVYPM